MRLVFGANFYEGVNPQSGVLGVLFLIFVSISELVLVLVSSLRLATYVFERKIRVVFLASSWGSAAIAFANVYLLLQVFSAGDSFAGTAFSGLFVNSAVALGPFGLLCVVHRRRGGCVVTHACIAVGVVFTSALLCFQRWAWGISRLFRAQLL